MRTSTRCYAVPNDRVESLGPTNKAPLSQKLSAPKHSQISKDIINKGLSNLDNPVLRGSFTLVLSKDQLDFLDKIARQAFLEIVSPPFYLYKLTSSSEKHNTTKTNLKTAADPVLKGLVHTRSLCFLTC